MEKRRKYSEETEKRFRGKRGQILKDHLPAYKGEGVPISEYLKKAKETETGEAYTADVLNTVKGMAECMKWVHLNRYLHLNLTPDSFVMSDRGVLLSDISLLYDYNKEPLKPDPERLADHIIETPFTAPETIQTDRQPEVHFNSDVYSLGAILYAELIGPSSGHSYTANDYLYLPEQIQQSNALGAAKEDAQRSVLRILMNTLSKNPRYRYPNVEQLADSLNEAVAVCREPRELKEAAKTVTEKLQAIGASDLKAERHINNDAETAFRISGTLPNDAVFGMTVDEGFNGPIAQIKGISNDKAVSKEMLFSSIWPNIEELSFEDESLDPDDFMRAEYTDSQEFDQQIAMLKEVGQTELMSFKEAAVSVLSESPDRGSWNGMENQEGSRMAENLEESGIAASLEKTLMTRKLWESRDIRCDSELAAIMKNGIDKTMKYDRTVSLAIKNIEVMKEILDRSAAADYGLFTLQSASQTLAVLSEAEQEEDERLENIGPESQLSAWELNIAKETSLYAGNAYHAVQKEVIDPLHDISNRTANSLLRYLAEEMEGIDHDYMMSENGWALENTIAGKRSIELDSIQYVADTLADDDGRREYGDKYYDLVQFAISQPREDGEYDLTLYRMPAPLVENMPMAMAAAAKYSLTRDEFEENTGQSYDEIFHPQDEDKALFSGFESLGSVKTAIGEKGEAEIRDAFLDGVRNSSISSEDAMHAAYVLAQPHGPLENICAETQDIISERELAADISEPEQESEVPKHSGDDEPEL